MFSIFSSALPLFLTGLAITIIAHRRVNNQHNIRTASRWFTFGCGLMTVSMTPVAVTAILIFV